MTKHNQIYILIKSKANAAFQRDETEYIPFPSSKYIVN